MTKKKLKEHLINHEWCKGCSICVKLCPKQVLEGDDHDKVVAARPEQCICCKLCESRCPDFAIEIIVENLQQTYGLGRQSTQAPPALCESTSTAASIKRTPCAPRSTVE